MRVATLCDNPTISSLGGQQSYCIRAYAEALEVIPYTLAENAGLNPIVIVTELRKMHTLGSHLSGINVRKVRWMNPLRSGCSDRPRVLAALPHS
jgi:chaperonin GroEL (HSP60 family)